MEFLLIYESLGMITMQSSIDLRIVESVAEEREKEFAVFIKAIMENTEFPKVA